MAGMNTRRSGRMPLVFIGLTLAACLSALWLRVPLLSLYWARVIATTDASTVQARYLAALCNAGPDGAWGVARLVDHPRPDVRQCAAVALQRISSPWGRAQLVGLLADADADVRALAALGLAMQRDDAVIPALTELFQTGNPESIDAAAGALARLGTPAALEALLALSGRPASAIQRAALIDSFDELRDPRAVPALLEMLDDGGACDADRRAERQAWRSVDLGALTAAGTGVTPTAPDPRSGPTTIAARAADTLARITGIPAEPRAAAADSAGGESRARWRAWWSQHRAALPATHPALPPSP